MWRIIAAMLIITAMLNPASPEPTEDWIKLHQEWQRFMSEYCQCPPPPSACQCRPSARMDASQFFAVRKIAARVFEFKECDEVRK